jgi:hypothetical protein
MSKGMMALKAAKTEYFQTYEKATAASPGITPGNS